MHTLPSLVHTVALGAGRAAVPSLCPEISGGCHLIQTCTPIHMPTHPSSPTGLIRCAWHTTTPRRLITEDTTVRPEACGPCLWPKPNLTTGEALMLTAARCTAPCNACCTTTPGPSPPGGGCTHPVSAHFPSENSAGEYHGPAAPGLPL